MTQGSHHRTAAAPEHHERLGRRIAGVRSKLGWTQQQLAERLGISRVAVSHLEAGTSVPGERTVALVAGLAKVDPPELVAGTDYPQAKADRLPLVAARYTEAELQVRLLDADLAWLSGAPADVAEAALRSWRVRLAVLESATVDRHERDLLVDARAQVLAALDALRPPV